MEPSLRITLPPWLQLDSLERIFAFIGAKDGKATAMLVGGCVRNAVLNAAETDIDIATQYEPIEVVERLNAEHIKTIPTGIEHGTVTAVVDGVSFEITTLREDIKTDGRHAEVSFTQSWKKDAARRDFTMNTLLADLNGNIYDPLGQGLEDLQQGRVIFVGNPANRIEEDYLRILRFFRFQAHFGKTELDKAALEACEQAAPQISNLSRERVTYEYLKILEAENAPNVLDTMRHHHILENIISEAYDIHHLKALVKLQKNHSAINILSRYFVVAGNKARFYEDDLRLSHAQKNFLVKLDSIYNQSFFDTEKEIKKAIFYHGRDIVMQAYLLSLAEEKVSDSGYASLIKGWQVPSCPITGETLLAEGYHTGPELGQELARRQEEWLDENL
jgi:poly(A) polymerase